MLSALFTGIMSSTLKLFFVTLGLFGIGLLIGIHELGHFLFCKLFKIRTPSFSIGLGPRLIEKKIGDTVFTLSALPLGGYVEIAGAQEVGQGDQAEAHRDDQYSFNRKPYYQKLLVMLGGIMFNILFSYIALSFLFYVGMPQTPLIYPAYASTTIKTVVEGSPAATANLQAGDKIVGFNDTKLESSPEQLIEAIKKQPNQIINLNVERNNHITTVPVTIGSKKIKDEEFGYLGTEFATPRFSALESVKHGIKATHMIIVKIALIFKQMFQGESIGSLGGPLMVISQTADGASKGFKIFLLLLAFISVNLAVLNLIPVPIMDGGQIVFYTIEAIIGRKIPDRVREYIHYACWIGFLILIVYLSIKDIWHLAFAR